MFFVRLCVLPATAKKRRKRKRNPDTDLGMSRDAAGGELNPLWPRGEELGPPSKQATMPARRTKLVFVYSSDDDDDSIRPVAVGKGEGGEMQKNGVGNSSGGAVAVVLEKGACLMPPPEELSLMCQEAADWKSKEQMKGRFDDEMPGLVEDLKGVVEPVRRERVKVVDALPLREVATLRKYLQAEDVSGLKHSRKRFREEEGGCQDSFDPITEGAEGPKPLFDSDGLVRSVEVNGYFLTVDETELQDSNGVEKVGEKELEYSNKTGNGVLHESDDEQEGGEGRSSAPGEEEESQWSEEVGEDFEEEEDEELDAALVIAVVEQLVRCCESDELDEALRDDGNEFLARVRPLLERVGTGSMEASAFEEEVRDDILKLQRALKRASRPKEHPIVINDVVMDM
ncbi:unnamed protein product [Trypanosoma congolense IL3000]|uniref:WGS project CAEQ00000000 data, annotated contig 1974 n=1 Tax=Trypanosoma congolense (strain IL3000) TaxID=1068625 RepID=F9WAH4_TRYCI|nr:unnamed protein product [Trypanosoma congolense IL3000]